MALNLFRVFWVSLNMLYVCLFWHFGLGFATGKVASRNCSDISCSTANISILSPKPTDTTPDTSSTRAFTSRPSKSSLKDEKFITPSTSHMPHSVIQEGIKVAKWDFKRVQTPFVVCIWILLASIAKIGKKN